MHTFADPLNRAVRIARDDQAVVDGDTRFTYGELASRCARLVSGLYGLGLEPGDRVAILAANSAPYLEAYLGIPAGNLVIVPLNTRHAEPELQYALADSEARVLITDRDPGALAEMVEHVVSIPDGYAQLVDRAGEAALGTGVMSDTLAGLFYTGGTTGASKGVMLSHGNLIANAHHMMATQPMLRGDRFAVIAPMFHAAGSFAVLATVWTAGCHVMLPVFEPNAAVDLVEREAITATLIVPTMLAAMAESQLEHGRDTSHLRELGHGGSPVATEVVRRAHKAFPSARLTHWYGATETAPIATALPNEQDVLDGPRARSCGQPAVGLDVRVVDPNGNELPPGEVGEVVIRGANVMMGYWNKPEQTEAALRRDDAGVVWYQSGDLGYADEEQFIFLVDRLKDMIVSGGENVYCTEVEEVLYAHPMVLEAAVFGIPDDTWGEAVYAVVVARGKVTPEELVGHCEQHIASYKVPKQVEVRDDPLPKSGPGKVLKRELREPFWAGQDARVS
ncbi:MAG: class I adenylate-forming enzyme family protein [Actinomycetota bacterium]